LIKRDIEMQNRKLILSILFVGAAFTMATVTTWAYYNDITTLSENTITVGTLCLTTNSHTSLMTVEDVSAGSSGTMYQTITNSGNVPGKLKIEFDTIKEIVVTEIPSSTGTDTLLDSVKVNIKLVKADDDSLVQQLAGSDLYPVPIASCSGMSIPNIAIADNTAYKLVIFYEVPKDTDTGIKGKMLTFGVKYTLTS
jgi:predicted ribosomally synthesized peptide with SipW-like signal peptide